MAIKLSESGRSGGEQANSAAKKPDLVQACGRAAEHMAKARIALDGGPIDAGRALDHLDEAISCLRGLSRRNGAAADFAGDTVVAFETAKDRRSA